MSADADNKKQATTIAQLVEISSNDAKGYVQSGHADNLADSPNIKSAEQKRKKVELLDRLRELHMLVPGSDLNREILDDYRRIKRPLVSNAVGKNKLMVERGNLILVTSSLPGEGKTHTALNLALSIAQEMDTTVLLVDCDVAKHGVSRMLGIEKAEGLVDVLENESVTVGDVMMQTDIPTLSVMSAGKQHEYVTELLASDRMSALTDEIANRYSDRIVIFDGPPLLPTPQTQVLAGLVGQVVFVIETGKTPQALVEEALELIPEEQAVGLVLNKNEGLSGKGSYYYGYYGPVVDD
ncbi:MAG: XrtA-associated tyrosine autokinase [Gammaproteobacteria bacterium]